VFKSFHTSTVSLFATKGKEVEVRRRVRTLMLYIITEAKTISMRVTLKRKGLTKREREREGRVK
jgi:hypothetical protein